MVIGTIFWLIILDYVKDNNTRQRQYHMHNNKKAEYLWLCGAAKNKWIYASQRQDIVPNIFFMQEC